MSFDLYVLKSWDGNNENYGPDHWRLTVECGPTLLDTTFSNNHKTSAGDLSLQNYPRHGSAPQTSSVAVNSHGYKFYGDSIYHLTFSFAHSGETLVLHFSSSLFEGKGIDDESWGLDNVRITTNRDWSRSGTLGSFPTSSKKERCSPGRKEPLQHTQCCVNGG